MPRSGPETVDSHPDPANPPLVWAVLDSSQSVLQWSFGASVGPNDSYSCSLGWTASNDDQLLVVLAGNLPQKCSKAKVVKFYVRLLLIVSIQAPLYLLLISFSTYVLFVVDELGLLLRGFLVLVYPAVSQPIQDEAACNGFEP